MTPGRLLYLTRRRWQLGLRHWIAERFLDGRIDNWRQPDDLISSPVPVHMLTSKHDWHMALWMLASLHEATRLSWEIVLHEDGSLGDFQLESFTRLFPDIRIIRRKDANIRMSGLLKPYPRCANYRNRMPHGLKAFDIPQLTDAPRFLLLDPDVLFFSRPWEILDWINTPDDLSCWFNQDMQEPSPLSLERARQEFGIELWPRVNSGLCLLTRASVSDLDAMESWLSLPELQNPDTQWRVEQTLLALSASRTGRGGLLSPDYEVSTARHRRSDCITRHYVGRVRDRFLSEGVTHLAPRLIPA